MAGVHKWTVCPKLRPAARMRLFCFPYAGVGISAFRGWADHSDPTIEVWGVQLPGREGRLKERPFSSMDELIPPLVEALSGLLDRPYVLYGHSLGAPIAFETARAFRRSRRRPPAHLFVGASPAPQLPWPHPLMHRLAEDDFLNEIQTRYGGIPRLVMEDPELRAALVPALRADITIMETYRYRPEAPLDLGITAFAGTRDTMVTPAAITEWRHQATQAFQLEDLDGDHFFTQTVRHRLLETIRTTMAGRGRQKEPLDSWALTGTHP